MENKNFVGFFSFLLLRNFFISCPSNKKEEKFFPFYYFFLNLWIFYDFWENVEEEKIQFNFHILWSLNEGYFVVLFVVPEGFEFFQINSGHVNFYLFYLFKIKFKLLLHFFTIFYNHNHEIDKFNCHKRLWHPSYPLNHNSIISKQKMWKMWKIKFPYCFCCLVFYLLSKHSQPALTNLQRWMRDYEWIKYLEWKSHKLFYIINFHSFCLKWKIEFSPQHKKKTKKRWN